MLFVSVVKIYEKDFIQFEVKKTSIYFYYTEIWHHFFRKYLSRNVLTLKELTNDLKDQTFTLDTIIVIKSNE